MAGRRAKPTAVKALAGNPGKRKLNKSEPQPIRSGAPKAPTWVGYFGGILWKQLANDLDKLGLLTNIDLVMFGALCERYDAYRNALKVIKKEGRTYKANGMIKKRPEVDMAKESLKELRMVASEFGMSPAARARVAAALEHPQLPGAEGWEASTDPSKTEMPSLPGEGLNEDDYFSEVRH